MRSKDPPGRKAITWMWKFQVTRASGRINIIGIQQAVTQFWHPHKRFLRDNTHGFWSPPPSPMKYRWDALPLVIVYLAFSSQLLLNLISLSWSLLLFITLKIHCSGLSFTSSWDIKGETKIINQQSAPPTLFRHYTLFQRDISPLRKLQLKDFFHLRHSSCWPTSVLRPSRDRTISYSARLSWMNAACGKKSNSPPSLRRNNLKLWN